MFGKSDIEKLERFSKGLSNEAEKNYIYSLFANNETDRDFKKQIQKEFDSYLEENPKEDYDLTYLLARIHHIIHKKESKKKQPVVRKVYQWYSAAAAVLLIPLIILGGLWISEYRQQKTLLVENSVESTLFAPLGSRISFSLPDGTKGWLNSGSSLEYRLPFNNNRQVVVLGEAWFDVVHDVKHPFEITTGDSKVKVLGTKFNLSAYPDEKYVEVTLEDGKVEFSTPGLKSAVVMKPNERLVFRENSVNINVTDVEKYSSWKEGKLVFRGDSMGEVARRIGRWYNVDVKLVDKGLENYSFRGTFEDDSLEEVLKFLSMTSPMKYHIVDRTQLDDNTILKRKVLLYKKNI